MKGIFLLTLLIGLSVGPKAKAQIISDTGYPEHFAVGTIVGGATAYITYKKTDNKFMAWVYGSIASIGLGLAKEIADPLLFNRPRNMRDFQYTALGGLVGASIVIPLGKKKKNKQKKAGP